MINPNEKSKVSSKYIVYILPKILNKLKKYNFSNEYHIKKNIGYLDLCICGYIDSIFM